MHGPSSNPSTEKTKEKKQQNKNNMKRLYFIFAAVMLLTACGGSSSPRQDRTAPGAIPWFGEVLNSYRELYLSGNDLKQIEEGMKEVIEKNKQNTIPVEGSPYGISIKEAVIVDCNITYYGMNIILQLIPEEGTDLHLVKGRSTVMDIYKGPYGNNVWCKAYAGKKRMDSNICHYKEDKMFVTLGIYYKHFMDWKELDRIVLSEKE